MKRKVYTVRDAKAELFNTPFYQTTHGEAERTFKNLVQDKTSMVGKYPEDYDLYYMGEFDDNTGNIMSLETPQHIVKAVQLQG
mgnify:CR=1 FL=1|jgi:hypothetical protein